MNWFKWFLNRGWETTPQKVSSYPLCLMVGDTAIIVYNGVEHRRIATKSERFDDVHQLASFVLQEVA